MYILLVYAVFAPGIDFQGHFLYLWTYIYIKSQIMQI